MPAPSISSPTQPRIGISGWSHPGWKGLAYPRAANANRQSLDAISRLVDLVEIDETFQHAIRPETAAVWLSAVRENPRFQFTALLHRAFTYDRELAPDLVASWKHGLRPLLKAGKLGAVVMQFPWAFRYSRENREHLIRLRREFHEFPLAAEFRHGSWHFEEAIGTLIDYRISAVNLDQPQYFRALPPAALLTNSVAYVRLHGRLGRESFQEFSGPAAPPYLYNFAELEEWQTRVARLASFAERTYVVFTNPAQGRSLVNALQMETLQGSPLRPMPRELEAMWWREVALTRARRPAPTRPAASTIRAA